MDDTEVGSEGRYTHDPEQVAEQGFQALMDGKDHLYPSAMKTKSEREGSQFPPQSTQAKMQEKQSETKKKAS
jgi:short-subunit dehydrogenase